jgi:hypothetical protein
MNPQAWAVVVVASAVAGVVGSFVGAFLERRHLDQRAHDLAATFRARQGTPTHKPIFDEGAAYGLEAFSRSLVVK